ncbi:transcriptional regulator [Enterovibrio norvegicus FF-162]|uniref:DJ-1/PfpI family protein n=1 Tax=Enterovibrio norvegicus TaxID=188144 RepID=UPI0002F53D3D|nr:DJ-1/PfpI family protein [Enterovibrio norvegicus]OEE88850.1 transcriptional regulator [Enterovibrio norvegicus FF-162]
MKTLTKFVFFVVLSITANIASAASSKIGILVFDGFLTSDVTAPIEVFGAATKKSWFSSYEVVVISATEDKTVISEEGLKVVADQTIYDTIELDVLLVPSAYDMGDYIDNDNLISFIEKQGVSASWIASNCSGAFLLGEAGILDGKKATTWAGGEKDLAMSYPKINVQYDQNVVIDSNVITSNGGPVSYQAAFELLAKLSSEKFANEISESIQFNRLDRAFRP